MHPVQVQGPKSGLTLEKIAGKGIYDIKYYWCGHFQIGDIPVVISRTGWSAVPGFEVNLLDYSRGAELWDAIMAAGEEFAIRPISPNEARRVEAGIFNWGSDISLKDTPVPRDGAGAAGRGAAAGLHRQGGAGAHPCRRRRPQAGRDRVRLDRAADRDPRQLAGVLQRPEVGKVTDAVWSPGLGKNIGYVWVPIELAEPGNASSGRVRARHADRRAPPPSRSSTRARSGRRLRSPARLSADMREPRFDVLFEPVQIGPVTARNRFFQVPHCNGMGWLHPSGHAAMRGVKAEGGWAVVCTEEVEFHHSAEHAPYIEGRIWEDADIPAHERLVERVHEHGSLAGIELVHSGMMAPTCTRASRRWAPATWPCTAPTRCRRGA